LEMPLARLNALSLLAPAALLAATALLLALPAAGADEAAGIDDAQLLRAARAASTIYQYKLHGLIGDLASNDPAVRLQALSDLGHLSDPAVIPVLLPWLQSSNRSSAEIIAAASALSVAGAEAAVPVLHGLLKHPDHEVRATAMNVLTSIAKIQPNDYKARSDDADDVIRGSSLTELGTLAQSDAAALLVKGLAKDPRPHIRRMCAIGLGNLGDKALGPNLTDALADADPGVRRYAAEALVKIGYTSSIPSMLMALEANVAGAHINRCLMLMSKTDFGFDPRADTLSREAAIEKGFQWWTAHAQDLNAAH
jgi:HEAT repeat protein